MHLSKPCQFANPAPGGNGPDDFHRANLAGANFEQAVLRGARLTSALLDRAELRRTDFTDAFLENTHFRGAVFAETNLNSALLQGAEFTDSVLQQALLINCDLAPLCRARRTKFTGPSTVDFRSVVLSACEPKLKEFLRRTGMPEVFVEYDVSCAQALTGSERRSLLQSSFFSYGGPDEPFATELNEALLDQGVVTFLFSKDAVPGRRLSRVMHEGVNNYDRVILVCSRASLDRPGVLNEIQETLDREARDGGAEYLLPVRLDDYVFTDWAPGNAHLARAVRSRVVADFTSAERFSDGVGKLVRALLKK